MRNINAYHHHHYHDGDNDDDGDGNRCSPQTSSAIIMEGESRGTSGSLDSFSHGCCSSSITVILWAGSTFSRLGKEMADIRSRAGRPYKD